MVVSGYVVGFAGGTWRTYGNGGVGMGGYQLGTMGRFDFIRSWRRIVEDGRCHCEWMSSWWAGGRGGGRDGSTGDVLEEGAERYKKGGESEAEEARERRMGKGTDLKDRNKWHIWSWLEFSCSERMISTVDFLITLLG